MYFLKERQSELCEDKIYCSIAEGPKRRADIRGGCGSVTLICILRISLPRYVTNRRSTKGPKKRKNSNPSKMSFHQIVSIGCFIGILWEEKQWRGPAEEKAIHIMYNAWNVEVTRGTDSALCGSSSTERTHIMASFITQQVLRIRTVECHKSSWGRS